MSKRVLALVTLVFFLNLLIACTSTESLSGARIAKSPLNTAVKKSQLEGDQTKSEGRIDSKKFEEILLITNKPELLKGKIIGLEGDALRFLPFPYWNVEPFKIALDEIISIEILKKGESRALKGVANGFGFGFLITGILAGASSKYNEDYQSALLGSVLVGGLFGLVGLVIGGASSLASKSKYDFSKMSGLEKQKTIQKIIGY
jgi:hypothetical protein